MRRKFHAPLWSSGRRGDPSTDCNRLNLDVRQRVAATGRRVNTLCKAEDGLLQQLALFQVYHNQQSFSRVRVSMFGADRQ